jgi:serine/threonine protein kinase
MFQRKDFKKIEYLESDMKKNTRVFKVEHIITKKIYALKEVEVSVGLEEYNKLNQCKEEAIQLSKAKNHPNIVQFYGYYFYKNAEKNKYKLGLICEYLESDKNLENIYRIRHNKGHYWKEDEILKIFQSLIDGLAFLQANGNFHGNIKPSNVFLTDEGIIKIIGFGQTFNKNKETDPVKLMITTPQYLSPTLWKSYVFTNKNIIHDPFKSDVFSAGLILFQLTSLKDITGLNQKTLYNDGESLIKIGLKSLKTKYSHRLIDILSKMLEYEEENRSTFIELQSYMKDLLLIGVEEQVPIVVEITPRQKKENDKISIFKRFREEHKLKFNMNKKTYWFEFGGNMIAEYDFTKKDRKWELIGKHKEKNGLFSTHCITIFTNDEYGYFLLGGDDENNTYQFKDGNITKKKSMNIIRSFMSCIYVNNTILAIGGYQYKDDNNNQQLKSIEVYDLKTDTWIKDKYSDLNIARSQASSLLFDDVTIFVIGGYNKTDFSLDTIEKIDLVTYKTILLEVKLPIPIRRCGLLKMSEISILILGGKTVAGNELCNVFCFDIIHEIFSNFKNLSKPGIIEHELIVDETGLLHIFLENNYGNSPPSHITYQFLDYK